MKRIIKLTILLLALLMPANAVADNDYTFGLNGIYYEIWNEYALVVGYYNDPQVLNIPSSVTYNGTTYPVTFIESKAFLNCTSLTNITIPNSVYKIGDNAFRGCTALRSVKIPYPVRIIGTGAFIGCTNLTSVSIPCSVSEMGKHAFGNCTALTSVKYQMYGIYSGGVIGEGAFYGCSSLSDLDIYSAKVIGDNAFEKCTSLTSVTIPENIQSIGAGIFSGCSGLTKITVASGNSYYDSRNNCKAIIEKASNTLIAGCQNTVIPNTVVKIGDKAFDDCSGLTSVNIPNSVTEIGNYAFNKCSGLTGALSIPNSVTTIGNYAFSECNGLTALDLGNSVTTIGNYAFNKCSGLIGSLSIPNSVTTIGDYSFSECSGLTGNLNIPNFVTTIGNYTFSGCNGLTALNIGNSVITIGNNAFKECSGLTGNLNIPNSVTEIGYFAFGNCSGLTGVTIGNTVTTIGSSAFSGCSNIAKIIVASGNSHYDSRNNCNAIIETPSNNLIFGCKNTIIPNTVVTIGNSAFYQCIGLTSVNLPNSVTEIGNYAFYCCTGLTSINIPNSVTEIGNSAFEYCSGLTDVIIGNSVMSIGSYAFSGANSIDCMKCMGKEPPVMENSRCFDNGVYSQAILYVPCESYGVYQNTDYWSKFSHIECFNDISRGDADGSGSVNIDDVTALIDYLLSGNADDIDLTGADAYPDGKINIDDVTALINYLLSGVWADDPVTPEEPETDTYTVNGVSFKMVKVKGGSFTMGATAEQDDAYDEEKPAHKVTLTDFSIGQTEVTQELWQAVMGENNSYHTGNLQYPADCVSWDEAQEFITQLNALTGLSFHLPTEAQWEFAARGGIKSRGYKHSGSNTLSEVAWYGSNSGGWTQPVGTKKANELGIYDMNGNVWEWTQDWYGAYSGSEQTNPTGPDSGDAKVHRGGCFNNDARYSRVSGKRHTYPPFVGSTGEGFRLAMTAPTISLSQTQITVKVGESKTVDILNGSGSYTCTTSSSNVTCQISGEKLYVTGRYIGSCTITVTDVITHMTASLSVTVKSSDSFGVLNYMIRIELGDIIKNDILNGHGSYSCEASSSCVSCWIEGEKVVVKGLSLGSCMITVKDLVSGATTRFSVTVVFADQTFTVNGVSFTMVAVEGGTYTMGATSEQPTSSSSNEKPTHQVTLSRYKIGQTEVTQALWLAVMGNNPSSFRDGLDLPVENVSWDECQTFIAKLNELTGKQFRLPTEAEWEYAARGGNKSKGYVYAGSNTWSDVAWCSGTALDWTHPVATKSPNELGLYDMSGNVEEWCQDYYGAYSSGSVTNPTGPTTGTSRVQRGGCWRVVPSSCRVSARDNLQPSVKSSDQGLRLAL